MTKPARTAPVTDAEIVVSEDEERRLEALRVAMQAERARGQRES